MKINKLSITTFFISVISVFGLSFAGLAYAASAELSFTSYKQTETNWCWATNGQSIAKYYGITLTQCAFVKSGKGTSTCNNDPGSDAEVKTGLKSNNITSTSYSGYLNVTQVSSEINAGRPIYVNWQWTNRTVGHAVTIYGYDYTVDPTRWYVKYSDPDTGTKTTVQWSTLNDDGLGRYWNSGLKEIKN